MGPRKGAHPFPLRSGRVYDERERAAAAADHVAVVACARLDARVTTLGPLAFAIAEPFGSSCMAAKLLLCCPERPRLQRGGGISPVTRAASPAQSPLGGVIAV